MNRSTFLRKCLDSLINQTYRGFEIIVVDGGSVDDTKDWVSEYPVKFLLQQGSGMCNARNFGIQHAQGEIIAFIDDDATANENWLKGLVKIYAMGRNIGGVGGKVVQSAAHTPQYRHNGIAKLVLDLPRVILRYDEPIYQGRIFRGVTYPIGGECVQDVDWLIGCNMSFRAEALNKVFGFDEAFYGVSWGEDADTCLRIKSLGCRLVYTPNAIVYHWLCPRMRNTFELIDNAYYLALKHGMLVSRCWFYFVTFVLLESRRSVWEQRRYPTWYLRTWIGASISARRRYKCSRR